MRSFVAAKGEPERLRLRDRKAVSGVSDRVGEQGREGGVACPFPRRPFLRMPPRVDCAGGREHGERPARRDRAVKGGKRLRRLADAEESGAPPLAVGDKPDRIAPQPAEMGIDDANRRADGDRRLDHVAAGAQNLRARFGRERMRACHDSELTASLMTVLSAWMREAGLGSARQVRQPPS